MTEYSAATEKVALWLLNTDWATRLRLFHADFVTSAAHGVDLDHDQLRDLAKMLYAAIFEDFLTVRFGRRGQLNVIDDYLRQDGRREPAHCRRYLEAARDSTPSLYEVVNIDPGRSVTVRDLLFGGEPVTVLEHLGSQALAPWDRVAARVLAAGEEWRFSGSLLLLRREASDRALRAIDRRVKRARRKPRRRRRRSPAARPITRDAIIRSLPCARLLARFWVLDTVDKAQAPLPELRNSDDEAMVLCEVRFPILGDEARISAVLDGIESFERTDDGDRHWRWSAQGFPSRPASGRDSRNAVMVSVTGDGWVKLGDVEVGDGEVTLRANSIERTERGQALLSSRLGHLVGRAATSSHDPHQDMKASSGKPAQDDIEPPNEDAVRAMHEFLDRHYRRTLDDPLPVLGGRTLRQAAATARGRREVVNWIKDVENIEYRRGLKQGRRAYDCSWIWEELGIERHR